MSRFHTHIAVVSNIRLFVSLVNGVDRGMGVLDGDRRRGSDSLGVNLGRPIVTNGDFATRLFPNYFGQNLLYCINKLSVYH